MKRFLLGLAAGIVLCGLALFVLMLVAIRLGGDRKVSIEDGTTVVLRLEGPIAEKPEVDIPIPIWQERAPLTVVGIWDTLRKAAADKRVKALVIVPHDVGAGYAKLHEIRDGIAKFRKSGKPVWAWLVNPGMREYYLATAADRICLSKEDFLDVKGVRADLMFLRRGLDKLGVEMEIEHAGKYKDAGDTLTRTSMSPETREVIESFVDRVYTHLVDTFAQARRKKPEEIRGLIDDGPFLATEALAKGLVDKLVFEDQFYDDLKALLGQKELKRVGGREYAKVPAASLGLSGGSKIALVVGEGDIQRGASTGDSDSAITAVAMTRLLRRVRNDDSIKAVILRIDSPGGDAIASDDILREVKLLSARKPMVISMSDVAASGGYYISMSGDTVLAYPNTVTGSIGVIYGKANIAGLYNNLGISRESISRGRFAEIDSEYKKLSDEGRQKLRASVDHVYRTFVGHVAEARKRRYEEIEPLAQGRAWLGSQAYERKLIDELGGIDRAIDLVRAKAGIPATDKVEIVVYPRQKTLFELLGGSSDSSVLTAARRVLGLDTPLPGEVRRFVRSFDTERWRRGGLFYRMPYCIEFN